MKFIILTICAYLIFRWLDRMFSGSKPKKSKQNAQRTNKENRSSGSSYENAKAKSVMKDNVGDYVDFEEVKDDE